MVTDPFFGNLTRVYQPPSAAPAPVQNYGLGTPTYAGPVIGNTQPAAEPAPADPLAALGTPTRVYSSGPGAGAAPAPQETYNPYTRPAPYQPAPQNDRFAFREGGYTPQRTYPGQGTVWTRPGGQWLFIDPYGQIPTSGGRGSWGEPRGTLDIEPVRSRYPAYIAPSAPAPAAPGQVFTGAGIGAGATVPGVSTPPGFMDAIAGGLLIGAMQVIPGIRETLIRRGYNEQVNEYQGRYQNLTERKTRFENDWLSSIAGDQFIGNTTRQKEFSSKWAPMISGDQFVGNVTEQEQFTARWAPYISGGEFTGDQELYGRYTGEFGEFSTRQKNLFGQYRAEAAGVEGSQRADYARYSTQLAGLQADIATFKGMKAPDTPIASIDKFLNKQLTGKDPSSDVLGVMVSAGQPVQFLGAPIMGGMIAGVREKPGTALLNVALGWSIGAAFTGAGAVGGAVLSRIPGTAAPWIGRGVQYGVAAGITIPYAVDVARRSKGSQYEFGKVLGSEVLPLIAGGASFARVPTFDIDTRRLRFGFNTEFEEIPPGRNPRQYAEQQLIQIQEIDLSKIGIDQAELVPKVEPQIDVEIIDLQHRTQTVAGETWVLPNTFIEEVSIRNWAAEQQLSLTRGSLRQRLQLRDTQAIGQFLQPSFTEYESLRLFETVFELPKEFTRTTTRSELWQLPKLFTSTEARTRAYTYEMPRLFEFETSQLRQYENTVQVPKLFEFTDQELRQYEQTEQQITPILTTFTVTVPKALTDLTRIPRMPWGEIPTFKPPKITIPKMPGMIPIMGGLPSGFGGMSSENLFGGYRYRETVPSWIKEFRGLFGSKKRRRTTKHKRRR